MNKNSSNIVLFKKKIVSLHQFYINNLYFFERMKKIMSVIMVAIMAICASISFVACGDDDNDSPTPIVKTQDAITKTEYATVYGLVDWNGNGGHKELGFEVWSKSKSEHIFFEAESSKKENFSARIDYNIKVGSTTQEWYQKGDQVYYQAVARNVKINGETKDVKGEIKNFVVD